MIDARDKVTNPAGRFKIDPKRLIGIALHHSVSGDYLTHQSSEADEIGQLQAIDRYHVSEGFGGIGYHLAAFASGRVYQTGDLDGARAHVANRNQELIGIVAIGTFTDRLPDRPQINALFEAIAFVDAFVGRTLTVKGHRDWAVEGQGTLCPGRIDEFDWTSPPQPGSGVMVRFNGIATWFEGRSLPDGAQGGVLDARAAFTLPAEARALRLEVALKQGAFSAGDTTYAGRVDDRYGARLGIIDVDLLPDGSLRYDCPPGTVVARIGCLGYWA